MKNTEEISNHEFQDNWTRTILQNAKISPATLGDAERLSKALTHGKPRWVVPSGFAAAASAGLIGAFVLLRPTPSVASLTLSQVDQAQLATSSFTVVHRIGVGSAGAFSVTESRAGNRWKLYYGLPNKASGGRTIMDGSRTIIIWGHGKNHPTSVLIDGPSKPPGQLRSVPTEENFLSTPSEIFRISKGPITVTKGVSWKGRTVDRFENVSEIRRNVNVSDGVKRSRELAEKMNQPIKVRHVLYADPVSHLPLEIETRCPDTPEGMSETFLYDYTPLTDSDFNPVFPHNAKVTDMRVERNSVHTALGRDGLVVVDDWGQAGVFLPDRPDIRAASRVHHVRASINGGPKSYTWTQPVTISSDGIPDGKTYWRQMLLFITPPVANLRLLNSSKTVTVNVNGQKFKMPVRHA